MTIQEMINKRAMEMKKKPYIELLEIVVSSVHCTEAFITYHAALQVVKNRMSAWEIYVYGENLK